MPPWASLLRPALRRARRKYVQLATVGPDGAPEVRTVVLRQFHADAGTLTFFTDRRSDKVAAMAHVPRVEVCWWTDKTREQFRLRGHLREDDAVAQDLWAQARPEARAPFFGPPPGTRIDPDAPPPVADEAKPDTFVGLLLTVDLVDYLYLGEPHRRRRFERTGDGWTDEAVVP